MRTISKIFSVICLATIESVQRIFALILSIICLGSPRPFPFASVHTTFSSYVCFLSVVHSIHLHSRPYYLYFICYLVWHLDTLIPNNLIPTYHPL
ncbi:uncharacterized protein C8Q71DRAFT_740605 [Rhodofomes roseus]|uniref:Secreted protein n=1 Tax=Rhodofomes roseus TaxID=34475 RepID=A0ABQ8KPW2_9APHY|nr:uncharacterized protein C8Q71DRAFT_740605 [Rhodofomes roseus]KAH9840653.1 hypothetical protein C8Q71DRAFT_740605 [Rhodofomes roseus]